MPRAPFKGPAEGFIAGIAHRQGDFLDGFAASLQQLQRAVHAGFFQIIGKGQARFFADQGGKPPVAQAEFQRQGAHAQLVIGIVRPHIFQQLLNQLPLLGFLAALSLLAQGLIVFIQQGEEALQRNIRQGTNDFLIQGPLIARGDQRIDKMGAEQLLFKGGAGAGAAVALIQAGQQGAQRLQIAHVCQLAQLLGSALG